MRKVTEKQRENVRYRKGIRERYFYINIYRREEKRDFENIEGNIAKIKNEREKRGNKK